MKASFTAVLAIAALAAASPQRPAGAPAGPLPTADPSLLAEFQSWTSQAGLSAFPTASNVTSCERLRSPETKTFDANTTEGQQLGSHKAQGCYASYQHTAVH